MNTLKTVALLGLLSGLLIVTSYWAIGSTAGAMVGLGLAVVTNFASWYYSDRLALAVFRAQPVNPAQASLLQPMVQRLCDRAHLPMPKLYVVYTPVANAFATGRSPERSAIAVTEGLLHLLPPAELEAVLAHELSHIRHRDTLTQSIAATIAAAITFLAKLAQHYIFSAFNLHQRSNPISLFLTVLLAPLGAAVIQFALSRSREFAADAGAARLTGNPRALASALQRLEQGQPLSNNPAFAPLLIIPALPQGFLMNLFATHPPTSNRIEQLLQLEASASATHYNVRSTLKQWRLSDRVLAIAAGLITILSVWVGWTYFSLNCAAATVEARWVQVENQLQRRADLIPKLVGVARISTQNSQEREILSLLVRSQAAYSQSTTPTAKAIANAEMDRAIERFQQVVATHPALQSNQIFPNLQYEIAGTENRIATERRRYNQAVQNYNREVQSFPYVFLAKTLGFKTLQPPQS